MAGPPEYQQREQVQASGSPLREFQAPSNPISADLGAADRALSGLGAELQAVATKLQEGQEQTIASQAKEQFLVKRADLTQKYVDDPDYATAEKRFGDEMDQLHRDTTANISNPKLRADVSLELTRDTLASANKVHTAQFARQADVNIAADDTLAQSALSDAVTAGSPQERGAAIDRRTQNLKRLQDAGWIDATTAVKRAQAFGQSLDRADVMALGQKDPAQALKALDDPNNFASLDPVTRQTFKAAFIEKDETNRNAMLGLIASEKPAQATAMVGRVTSPDAARHFFNDGMIPTESGGDPNAVSPKGALGVAQLMPATAREVAQSLGRNDVAALSDADLKARLLSDPQLNRDLGWTYYRQMVTRYDGNVALAAAAYNGGPARADAWKAQAEEKFGAAYTPAQLASVIDVKETRDYLGKIYSKLGAPMDTGFSSPAAMVRAATTVNSAMQVEDSRQKAALSLQATVQDQVTPINKLFKAGVDADPMAVENWVSSQQKAAAAGDQEAAGRLRDYSFNRTMQPLIREAWNTSPALLDGAIKDMNARITAPGANPSIQLLNARDAYQKVLDEQVKTRDTEPVMLGGQNGGRDYRLQPIDPKASLDDGLIANLQARDVQARQANAKYGGSGSPFTVQEAQGLHERYAQATPDERNALLGTLAKGLSGTTFAAALPQVVSGTNAKSDRPGITMAAGLYKDAPDVANGILQGIGGEETYLPNKANRQSYDTEKALRLPPALFTTPARLDPKGPYAGMQDAIDGRYAYLSAQANDSSKNLNTARVKQAADDVTGGIVYHNGVPALAPQRGMSQQQFDGIIWGLKDSDLAGAQTTRGTPIDAAYLRDVAKLRAQRDGQYYIQVNQDDARPQYAMSPTGAPFVLDLRNRQPAPIVYDPLKSGTPQP